MRKSRVLIACLLCAMAVFGLGVVGCGKKNNEPTKYNVVYERGADDATGEIPAAESKAEGESFALLPATTFARENYTFKCWAYDGREYDAGAQFTMPAGDVTFTAVWTADQGGNDRYTVTYNRGADDATGEIPAAESKAEGESFALLPATTFARENYTFKCWAYDGGEYDAGAQFTMPAGDVTFTAVWTADTQTPDVPTLGELSADFYTASKWEYMTNDGGAKNDGGDIPYSLDDGSIKFHRANQAIELEDMSNKTVSFMLKATNDFAVWFNSSTKDNSDNYSYRLVYAYGGLRLVLSSSPEKAAAVIGGQYKKGEWNRFDIAFSTTDNVTQVKVYINGLRAPLTAGDYTSPAVSVSDNTLSHRRPAMFKTGKYVVVKVWEAHNYVQLKPVAKADAADIPVVACIGASITEGAGAGNFYTESYPAQLQNALGGAYNVINFGKSGRTVRTDLGSDDDGTPVAWLENYQFDGVKAIKPDYAIFNIGTNDSKSTNVPLSTTETFKAAFEHLLDEVLAVNSDMKALVCTVPYAYSSIYGISNDNIRDIIAPVQRTVAQERGYTLIDLYEYSQNKSLLFGDGVHPNTTGYAMFVEIIEKAFKEGNAGLTEEFIASINQKYNDPEYELDNVRGNIAVSGDKINLTVTGKLVMDDLTEARLVVETGNEGEERSVPIAPSADGSFTAEMDISTLTSKSWYNIRVYLTNTFYYLVLLQDTDLKAGDKFHNSTTQVTVQSWNSGGGATFSFSVGGYNVFTLSSSVISDNKLTVSGTTADTGIRLYIGANPNESDKYNEFKTIAVGQNGAFTASFDLAELPIGGWYNARIYFSDGSYRPIGREETTDGENTLTTDSYFICGDKRIEIKSWTDGGVNTLSFDVKAYSGEFVPQASVTEAKIAVADGKIMFTARGTTNDSGLRLYVGNDESKSEYYHAVQYNDGTFTAAFDLASLAAGDGWYNVRLYYNEQFYTDGNTDYYSFKFPEVKNDSGAALKKDDVFFGTDKKVTIKSWADWNPLSLSIEAHDSSYSVTVGSIKFEDGQFVLTGTVANVTSLYVYLINTNVEGSLDNYVRATISDGTYTAKLPLATLAEYGKKTTPFNLRYKVNDLSSSVVNVAPADLDMTQVTSVDYNLFYLGANNGCVAVYYNEYNYRLTEAVIRAENGKASLVLAGTLKDDTVPAAELFLLLDETGTDTGKQKIVSSNLETENGKFRFVVDISAIESSTQALTANNGTSRHYYVRLYRGPDLTAENYNTSGTKVGDINSRWLSDKLFKQIAVEGDDSGYCFVRNSDTAYNTLGIVRVGATEAGKND